MQQRRLNRLLHILLPLLVLPIFEMVGLFAHQHIPVTHSFEKGSPGSGSRLVLNIVDESTGRDLAARFTLESNGETILPSWINENGISFTSIHESKNQRYTALFSKGDGPLTIELPEDIRQVTISLAKGFEYLPAERVVRIDKNETEVTMKLMRWVDLKQDGWIAIDEHLHYDRLDRKDDALWWKMLEADGLTVGHFMVLKGGMMPGVWSRQYAYGEDGFGSDENHILIPGQEYRDSQQGHINLLGVDEVILPYSTGGMGTPAVPENYPPLAKVLNKARAYNGFAGVAHGGTLGRNSTAMADAVLGAVDFWEISNGFIYDTENWYRLMNCGFFLPIAAGTDLPNSPYRDNWQPMFGSIRTYLNTDGDIGFDAFKNAMRSGQVFVSGGPLIDLRVNNQPMGSTVLLPEGGGIISVKAALHSPLQLRDLRIVKDGTDIDVDVQKRSINGINRWSIEKKIEVTESGWIAAWGRGVKITSQGFDAMAHTNSVRVIVGNEPVQSKQDASMLVELFEDRISWYQKNGVYKSEADRLEAVDIFNRAIDKLQEQVN